MRCLDLALSFILGLGLGPACADNLLTMGVSSGGSSAPVSFCVGSDTSTVHTTVTCTTSSAVPAHDSIIVVIGDSNIAGLITVTGVSDGTNTYTKQVQGLASTLNTAIFYFLDPASLASGSTITATFSAAGTGSKYIQAFYMNGTAVALASSSAGATSTTPSCGPLGGTSSRTAFGTVAMQTTNDTITQPSGWVAGTVGNSGSGSEESIGYKVNTDSTAFTYNPTGWSNAAWACALGTYQIGGYVGPGDFQPSASIWYGLRCYDVSKASASQAIKIRRASDNTTQDIGLTAACDLDIATATTFCASTTCFINTLYDQSGNGRNLTQATTGNQPQLIFNCIGSLPCIRNDGTKSMTGTLASSIAQPYTWATVADRTGNTAAFNAIIDFQDTPVTVEVELGFSSTANNAFIYDSASAIARNVAATDNSWHVLQGVWNGSSSLIRADATDSATAAFNTTATHTVIDLFLDAAARKLTGDWVEGGLWPLAFNAAQKTNMCNNEHTYWSTPGSC